MRLGDIGECGLKELHRRNSLQGVESSKLDFTSTVFSVTRAECNSNRRNPRLHSFKCLGLVAVASKGGSLYFVSFIDDYSQKVWVYLIKYKFEVLSKV
jgi:hypothetical protein